MDVLLEKGQNALVRGEWEEARKLLEEFISSSESAEAYEAAAWACWWLNDSASVFTYREKAYNLFIQENNLVSASRMASWIGVDYLEFKGELPVASGWLQRAEKLLEECGDSYELALIKILKARLTFMVDNDTALSLKLADESLRISRSVKSIEGEMIAEAFKGFLLVTEGKISEGMPLLDDAVVLALSAAASDVNMIVNTCCFLIDACQRVRDYQRAGQWCMKVKDICQRWKYRAMFASCRTQYASVLVLKGNWREAEEELLAAAGELKEFRPLQVSSSTIRLADLRRKQGRWAEAEKLLEEAGHHRLKPIISASLAYDKEEYDSALNTTERLLRKIPPDDKTERIEGIELLIRILIKIRNLDEAEKILNELEEIDRSIGTLPISAAYLHSKGIFNCAKELYVEAAENLEDAIDIYDNVGSPYEASQARIAFAEVLIKKGDNSGAEYELTSAKNIFRELGAEKDLTKAGIMLKNLYTGTGIPDDKNRFTKREREILVLIAGGESNEEIADKLFVSKRTVEKHLTNIYQKLGIKGKSARAYAASYAASNRDLE